MRVRSGSISVSISAAACSSAPSRSLAIVAHGSRRCETAEGILHSGCLRVIRARRRLYADVREYSVDAFVKTRIAGGDEGDGVRA